MKKKTYSELLSDPRWQKKRLEIMQRDNFTCQHCGCTTQALHVHHKYYNSSLPWEYPDNAYITLCEHCHALEHDDKEMIFLIHELNELGFTNRMIEDILRDILVKLVYFNYPIEEIEKYYFDKKFYYLDKNISIDNYICGIGYDEE